jgi:predicted protein tyrosine phosphatase
VFDAVCREVYRGERVALQVLDREAVRFCTPAEPYAVISITDPVFSHPNLPTSPYRQGVLQLYFSDVEERVARLKRLTPQVVAFTAEMAAQIVTFVQENMEQGVTLFLVHCEAGMSRSAGVAAAISRFYNGEDTFFQMHYRPNVWVQRLLAEEFKTAFPIAVE